MRPAKSNASECVKHLDNLIVIVGGLSRKLPGSTVRVKLEIDTKKQINMSFSFCLFKRSGLLSVLNPLQASGNLNETCHALTYYQVECKSSFSDTKI